MPKKKPSPPLPELETFPARLKFVRERSRLTGVALADKSGIDAPRISRLESGERVQGVEAATIIALAKALEVPVGWLTAGEGPLPPGPVFRETDRRRKKPNGA